MTLDTFNPTVTGTRSKRKQVLQEDARRVNKRAGTGPVYPCFYLDGRRCELVFQWIGRISVRHKPGWMRDKK